MIHPSYFYPSLLILLLSACVSEQIPYADLVVTNATIITVDSLQPYAEALAIKDGRILAIGSAEEVAILTGPQSRQIDAAGKTLIPGFNDAHIHPRPLYPDSSIFATVDLGPGHVSTIEELIEKLRWKASITPEGSWISGINYQDTKLGRHPTRLDLDQASTRHPIRIRHSSGHLAVYNSFALNAAGITPATPDPAGGQFDRAITGIPNGITRETAMAIVVHESGIEIPRPSIEEQAEGLISRLQRYANHGITSVQDAGADLVKVLVWEEAFEKGLPVRAYVMMLPHDLDQLALKAERYAEPTSLLRFGAIKLRHGNSLSGRTCWLYEPYADRPGYFGIPPKWSQDELNEQIVRVHRAGYQIGIHSNGDREIDMVLDAFAHAQSIFHRTDHRHRIEHSSIVNPSILNRMKELDIVLTPHSYIYEHGDKMEAYGEGRWNMMHPNKSALDYDIPAAGNSDAPVSAADPMLRLQSMVTRTSAEGKVYGENQRVSVEEALYLWTAGSAYAEFMEDTKGSLTVDKFADFVLLADDPRSVLPSQLSDIEIALTVVAGKVVFANETIFPELHVE